MTGDDLERDARNARDLAKRTRLIAQGLSLASDRERLNRYADETDARAAEMEAEAAALRAGKSRPAAEQRQAEQQQQGQASPRPVKPKD